MIMPIAWQKLSEGMHALDNVFVNKFDRDAMVEIAFNRTQAFLLLCQLLEQRLVCFANAQSSLRASPTYCFASMLRCMDILFLDTGHGAHVLG